MTAPHPADERPIRGLITPAGQHRVTRAGIDRALTAHQRAGRIRSWWYSDRVKNVRTVLLADGPAQGLTDRDAYHLVIGMKAAAARRLTVTMMAETDGQWNGQVADQFTVPGQVVEVKLSKGCEMVFVLADGTEIMSTDIGERIEDGS
jgi:hypothetical protein